jgi:acyl-coenzyme A thioesterase PaaI-like protein
MAPLSDTSAIVVFIGINKETSTTDVWEVAITDAGNNDLVFTGTITIEVVWGDP